MEILWISHVLIDMEMRSWLKVFYLRTNWLKTLKGVDKRQIFKYNKPDFPIFLVF